jgi:hypothetical protein
VPWCHVQLTLAPHPQQPKSPSLNVETMGFCHYDASQATTLQALNTFCEHHPMKVAIHHVGLFPEERNDDPMWLNRLDHMEDVTPEIHQLKVT